MCGSARRRLLPPRLPNVLHEGCCAGRQAAVVRCVLCHRHAGGAQLPSCAFRRGPGALERHAEGTHLLFVHHSHVAPGLCVPRRQLHLQPGGPSGQPCSWLSNPASRSGAMHACMCSLFHEVLKIENFTAGQGSHRQTGPAAERDAGWPHRFGIVRDGFLRTPGLRCRHACGFKQERAGAGSWFVVLA